MRSNLKDFQRFDLGNGFWVGFVIGLFYFSYIFSWLWQVYPLDSFGLENGPVSLLFLAVVFILSICLSAFFWGLFSSFIFYNQSRLKSCWFPAVFASAFTLVEYMRVWFWGIVWYGNGGLLGPHWTIGNIAYLFSDVPFILKTANIWGIYGVGFITALITGSVYIVTLKSTPKKYNYALANLIVLTVVLITVGGYQIDARSYKNEISVAIIQTNFPTKLTYSPEETLDDFHKKLNLLKEAAGGGGIDLIIFPEGANFLSNLSLFLNPEALRKYFMSLSKEGILIFDNIKIAENGKVISKSILISSKDGAIGSHDKKILTPGGEYLPLIIKIPLDILRFFFRFEYPVYLSRGDDSNTVSYGGISLKSMVCSELVSPSIVRDGFSNALVAVHNFGLFNGGELLEKQILAMSKFRAVENGVYSVTASNYGRSYIIGPDGKVKKRAQTKDYELITGNIGLAENQTLYARVGDWPFLLFSSVFITLVLRKKSG